MVATLRQFTLEDTPPCPVSGSRATEFLCEVNGFRIWRDPISATDFVWPTPSDEFLRRMYDEERYFEGMPAGGYESYDKQTENVLPAFEDILARCEIGGEDRSVLDIGCAYGTHLGIAARRGWKCFGVEISRHALKVARQRHGERVFFADSIDRLLPRQYDLVLLLDVIEHLKDPYDFFFTLFHKGAIGPETKVIVTTPNARSFEAVRDPQHWTYRHPPTHLVYYSAESLRVLFKRLQFRDVEITGLYPLKNVSPSAFTNEKSSLNDNLGRYGGLLSEASGSDFGSFVKRCYMPGNWSRGAGYRHIPPYLFARALSQGRKVLDFGCGTGFGSDLLAQVAGSVLAVDTDSQALSWASHRCTASNVRFEQTPPLGMGLPVASFDTVTCFDTLDRLSQSQQMELIANLSRLLTPEGRLVVKITNLPSRSATPDDLPKLEAEFAQLLRQFFPAVKIFRQWVRPSASIDTTSLPTRPPDYISSDSIRDDCVEHPVGFVAVCSQKPLPELNATYYFDASFDYDTQMQALEESVNGIQQENFQGFERIRVIEEQQSLIRKHDKTISTLQDEIKKLQDESRRQQHELVFHHQELEDAMGSLVAARGEIAAIKAGKLYRLKEAIRNEHFGPRKLLKIAYLLGAMATPEVIRSKFRPAIGRFKQRFTATTTASAPAVAPYQVRQIHASVENRPRILHAIANFNMGGSSRLVVDLIEHLGHKYEQEVISSHVPVLPSYSGVRVREFRDATRTAALKTFIESYRPHLIHVHYWGDCDREWYGNVVTTGVTLGCRFIENVNTPVVPYGSPAIERYIYVSDHVRLNFSADEAKSATIYPGTDFSRFGRQPGTGTTAENCAGMVYRLERDKLAESSIDVFLKVAQRRPQTRILIVGGGSLLAHFQRSVRRNRLSKSFQFTGYVSYEQLPSVYEQMGVFVAPVWKESFGQVSPMAMSYGIPVAGYDVGGLVEIVGDKQLLAPPGDSDRLAEIVVNLLEDREKRLAVGEQQRQRALAMFSVEAMIEQYASLYGELLGPK